MTARNYDIESSELIILQGNDGNSYKNVWAIFDVSPTVECRFVAIHWERAHPNETFQEFEMLTTFDHTHELLLWCAYKQAVRGAIFRTGNNQKRFQDIEWLEKICQGLGYESWQSYVDEQNFAVDPTQE